MVKRFKNGNIHIQFDKETIENLKSEKWSIIEVLSWELSDVDTDFIGEEFCISNYEMGVMLYNYCYDKCYILPFGYSEKILMNGKTLILNGYNPSDEERELIEREAA